MVARLKFLKIQVFFTFGIAVFPDCSPPILFYLLLSMVSLYDCLSLCCLFLMVTKIPWLSHAQRIVNGKEVVVISKIEESDVVSDLPSIGNAAVYTSGMVETQKLEHEDVSEDEIQVSEVQPADSQDAASVPDDSLSESEKNQQEIAAVTVQAVYRGYLVMFLIFWTRYRHGSLICSYWCFSFTLLYSDLSSLCEGSTCFQDLKRYNKATSSFPWSHG